MWKAVIADDEGVIVNGLKKLIDWQSLNVSIEGDARNGEQLLKEIERVEPDLVITDIKMPKMTGLEVQRRCARTHSKAKFIFISGYEEFSYAKEALTNGAVDYLLKPVGRKDLEEAVKKAITRREDQHTVDIFSEKRGEAQNLIWDDSQGENLDNDALLRLFEKEGISRENSFFVGICAGVRPDIAEELAEKSFQRYNLLRFSVFNRIAEGIQGKKHGFTVRTDRDCIHLMGVFSKDHVDDFAEIYIEPVRQRVEMEYNTKLCIGIGAVTDQMTMLRNTYKAAKFSFELYFFEEKQQICFDDIHRDYTVSFEDYGEAVEKAFRAIVAKDPEVLDKIDAIMDSIEALHYGNAYAVRARTLHFSDDLFSRLGQYHMLEGGIYEMQEQLQQIVSSQRTFRGLCLAVRDFYEIIVKKIYATGKSRDKVIIEEVKDYIKAHYAEDLSIKELADVACVSQNYFSAMFKKETGENYKAYLTSIRMKEALRLLQETDDKTYEIGEKVGYNNVRRFVEAFKQIYSVSPMEYKKGLHGGSAEKK